MKALIFKELSKKNRLFPRFVQYIVIGGTIYRGKILIKFKFFLT